MIEHLQWSFFAKIPNGVEMLTFSEEKLLPRCLTRLKISFWLKVLDNELTFVPNYKLSGKNTQPEKMCNIVFENAKDRSRKVSRASVYAEAAVRRVLSKRCYGKFRRIHKKTSVMEYLFGVFL